MSEFEMRQQVISAYPGWKWLTRVMEMHDRQLYAVWRRLKGCGKI